MTPLKLHLKLFCSHAQHNIAFYLSHSSCRCSLQNMFSLVRDIGKALVKPPGTLPSRNPPITCRGSFDLLLIFGAIKLTSDRKQYQPRGTLPIHRRSFFHQRSATATETLRKVRRGSFAKLQARRALQHLQSLPLTSMRAPASPEMGWHERCRSSSTG